MSEGKALAMFPAPYPDECLYSVFCRYHQRSGNYSERDTIMQLFGKYLALHSAILTPYRLNYYGRWYSPETGISRAALMMGHTAYQYYSLFNYSWRKASFLEIAAGCDKPPRTTALLARDVSTNKHLRYCPECVKEDRRLYGETYWHILPQLTGIEYCTSHQCRIQTSCVTMEHTKFHFVPANVITGIKAHISQKKITAGAEDDYLALARDSEWMLKNGDKIDSATADHMLAADAAKHTVAGCYSKDRITIYNNYVISYLRTLLENQSDPDFIKDLLAIYGMVSISANYWKFMLNCYAVRLVQIRCLYGSVQRFYDRMLRNVD